VVEGRRGAAEHVDGVVEFLLQVFVGLVCWRAVSRWAVERRNELGEVDLALPR
jgi:hypothetical protein